MGTHLLVLPLHLLQLALHLCLPLLHLQQLLVFGLQLLLLAGHLQERLHLRQNRTVRGCGLRPCRGPPLLPRGPPS